MAAIREASLGAIQTIVIDTVLPPAYRGGPMPSALADAMQEILTRDFERYFTPELRARYEPMLQAAFTPLTIQGD